MANSRKQTLSTSLVMTAARSNSLDLPMDSVINQIRLRVTGTYTGLDANLLAEFPFNIFRNISVKTGSGVFPYSIASKDIRILNYLDKAGKVTFSASGGNYQANLVLDRGELLALEQNQLPLPTNHPALPFGSLTLSVIWAQDTDIGSSNTLSTGTCEIEVEQTPMAISELQAVYGTALERYQLCEVFTIGDLAVVINTKPSLAIQLQTGQLKKRTVAVTSDTTAPIPVRSSVIVSELQLVNKRTGWEKTPLDRTFATMQNEDAEMYNLSTILAGVAAIDYPTEISNDPNGFPSWRLGDKDLQISTLNIANGNIRVIEEQRIINIQAFEAGNILGVVAGAFNAGTPAKS